MREEQHLLPRPARNRQFAVGERTRGKRGLDLNAVAARSQARAFARRHAETPAALVVAGAVGHPVGLSGQNVQALRQLIQRHDRLHRLGVPDQVQVVPLEIHDATPVGVDNRGILNVPLRGYLPVEDPGAAAHFVDLQWHPCPDECECLPDARPGDAPADRIQAFGKTVQRRPGLGIRDECGGRFHAGVPPASARRCASSASKADWWKSG